jgi:hypothetical protein
MSRLDLDYMDRWFRRVQKEFTPLAMEKAGQPIVYVEIGTWGGAASEWVCKHILTHPDSLAFGIDPYDQYFERRRHDVAAIKTLAADRVRAVIGGRYQWIYQRSRPGLMQLQNILRDLINDRRIDLLYVDGSHEGPDVFQDFALAWPMLHNGSIVIFDDYKKVEDYAWPHVRHACAAVELAYQYRIKPRHRGRQYALEVIEHELTGSFRKRMYPPATSWPNLAIPHLKEQDAI